VSDMYNLEVTRPLMTRHPVVATRVVTAVQAPVHAAEEASDSGRQRCLCVESSTGIEPATPSFPCIPGSPSCEPAFLQVAADRRTSSYVLCRDGRQAHLPADPKTDDDAYTGMPSSGGDLFPGDLAGLAAAETCATGAHRPHPGPAALHPHLTDRPGLQPPLGCTCGPSRPGRHLPRCRPNRHHDANQGRVRPLTALPKSLPQARSPSRVNRRDYRPRSAHR
jgi:hypothetical protein